MKHRFSILDIECFIQTLLFIYNLVLTNLHFLKDVNNYGNGKSDEEVWIYDVNYRNIVLKFMETLNCFVLVFYTIFFKIAIIDLGPLTFYHHF